MLHLDMIQTTAFAGLALFIGYGLRRAIPWFGRYNLPAPVVGGLFVAAAFSVCHAWDLTPVTFDDTLQRPLMSAFFTAIGFRVSLALLRRGGGAVLVFFVLSTLGAVLQNIVGVAVAVLLGQPPLFGVLCGSVTLTGGPATGLAFAPQFASAGIPAAEAVAIVAAIVGIVAGSVVGAPIATVMIERMHRRSASPRPVRTDTVADVVNELLPDPGKPRCADDHIEEYSMLKNITVLLMAMWIGSWLSAWLTANVMTLPLYMGGMITAAAIRNLDDATGWFGLSQRTLDLVGDVALSLFLVMALMTLELWKLAAVALPMVVILLAQIALMAAYCVGPVFARMGRDYEAAVMAGGFYGFMVGITANAMASMDSLVKHYGPAPLAYLVVPVVGAFFIDFINALLIQGCINLFK